MVAVLAKEADPGAIKQDGWTGHSLVRGLRCGGCDTNRGAEPQRKPVQ